MTRRDNRVAAREARGMLGGLERLGYDLDALLATAGLRRGDIEDPTRTSRLTPAG